MAAPPSCPPLIGCGALVAAPPTADWHNLISCRAKKNLILFCSQPAAYYLHFTSLMHLIKRGIIWKHEGKSAKSKAIWYLNTCLCLWNSFLVISESNKSHVIFTNSSSPLILSLRGNVVWVFTSISHTCFAWFAKFYLIFSVLVSWFPKISFIYLTAAVLQHLKWGGAKCQPSSQQDSDLSAGWLQTSHGNVSNWILKS